MSIYDVIDTKVKAGSLVSFPASILGFSMLRRIAMAPEVNKLVFSGTGAEDWKTRCVHLQVELQWFVDGGEVYVALPDENKPYEDRPDANLRLLYQWSDEVWEIRSKMQPQIRIFGRFAAPDYFIALIWEFRSKLGDPPWKQSAVCKDEWNLLFPQDLPLNGETIDDYITKNAFPC